MPETECNWINVYFKLQKKKLHLTFLEVLMVIGNCRHKSVLKAATQINALIYLFIEIYFNYWIRHGVTTRWQGMKQD